MWGLQCPRLEQPDFLRGGKIVGVSLRIQGNLAIGALAVAGLLLLVSPESPLAATPPGSCGPSPQAHALKLVVASQSVPAGQTLQFRVDNIAGPTIVYGADYAIQECLNGVWVLAPFSPKSATRQRIRQRPSRGRWWNAPISSTAESGAYRIRKAVQVEGRRRWLYGEFEVISDVSARRAASNPFENSELNATE